MMKHVAKLALGLAVVALAGCATSPALTVLPAQDEQAVVGNGPKAGNHAISITLVPPQEAGYQSQATVHRWVDADIFQYEVTLKVKNGGSFVDFATPLTVVVPRKGTPKTKAVFTHLKQGAIYQASVVAKGNVGGSAASTVLNSTAATAVFDFSAAQDVEDTLSASMRVTFDAVAFNGNGSANLQTPVDGSYSNPTAPEAGAAQ